MRTLPFTTSVVAIAFALSCTNAGPAAPDVAESVEMPWSSASTGFTLRQVALGRADPDGGMVTYMNVEYDAGARTLRGPVTDRWGSISTVGTLRMIDQTLSEGENSELLIYLRGLRAERVRCAGNDGIYTSLRIGATSYAIGGYNSCSVAGISSNMIPAITNGESLLLFLNRFAR